jgi:hypothetical protein
VSGRLFIEVSTERLDEARADVVVVAFFESDRPLRGAAGLADWRLCGQLSRLVMSEKLSGRTGEAVLLATGRGWSAPRVLGLGLGTEREFGAVAWESYARDAIGRVLRMRAETVAFPISGSYLGLLGVSERVGALLRGTVSAFAEDSAPLRMQLIATEADADKAREAVRKFASREPAAPAVAQPGVGLEL